MSPICRTCGAPITRAVPRGSTLIAVCAKCTDRGPLRCDACRGVLRAADQTCECGRSRWTGALFSPSAPKKAAKEQPPLQATVTARAGEAEVWATSRRFYLARPRALARFWTSFAAVWISTLIGAALVFPTPSVAWLAVLLLLLVLPVAAAMLSDGALSRMNVKAGGDGVLVRRPLGSTWFVPYSALTDIVVDEERIQLRWMDGSVRYLQLWVADYATEYSSYKMLDPRETPLVRALQDGMQRARAERTREASLLARGERSVPEWLDALEALAQSGASYRAAGITRDAVFTAAMDAAAEPTVRVGAAWLLRRWGLLPKERAALRTVRDRTANPRVRVALEAAARVGDDFDRELEAFGEDEPPARVQVARTIR